MELYAAYKLEEIQPLIVLQQDDAPPPWGLPFRQFLEATFPNRWIWNGVQHNDHHVHRTLPLWTFFMGYVKGKLYSTQVSDIDPLKARIRDALAAVTEDMLEKTWRKIEYRLDVPRITNGAYLEVY
jgi:hypothetical protein